ncbi:MAG: bacteriophage CI repressor [Desulfobulbaceae bacterium]|nr:bacteriophage CI repressor [Desulfobulbaceae bacterium]
MGSNDLLERVVTEAMDENLRTDILKYLFKVYDGKAIRIPQLKDCPSKLNCDEIYSRMKTVAGGTAANVAQLLGISQQGFSNQKLRKSISGNSIIDFHLKTGVSVDWLLGSWNGRSTDYIDSSTTSEAEMAKSVDYPSQKYLSLVEVYDQSSGTTELKWCLTKHHVCLGDDNLPIPDDFGALLSLIIRYKDKSGTPDRVKRGNKQNYQVRRVLAYVIGNPKLIRQLDAKAKKETAEFISGQVEREGKTEFRLYSSKDKCLDMFRILAGENGLSMVRPEHDAIAWDFLIGCRSMTPQNWILNKLKASMATDQPELVTSVETMVGWDAIPTGSV